jgi:hypothetical protein
MSVVAIIARRRDDTVCVCSLHNRPIFGEVELYSSGPSSPLSSLRRCDLLYIPPPFVERFFSLCHELVTLVHRSDARNRASHVI